MRFAFLLSIPQLVAIAAQAQPTATPAQASPPAHAEAPPALLEPYAGYDVVFAPRGERVLGPEAAGPVEKMLGQKLGDSCTVGDIQLQPASLRVTVQCPTSTGTPGASLWVLAVRGPGTPGTPELSTDAFVLQPPATSADPAVQKALLERVRQGEATIPWQRVRAQAGSAGGEFELALVRAQGLVATGDRPASRLLLHKAVAARRLEDCKPAELLDVALLAHEAQDPALFDDARKRLDVAVASKSESASLGAAAQALAGEATAATDAELACIQANAACDVIPTVRALAATEHFREASRLLDAGPLKARTPPRDLLKLRFGLASALNDADAVLAVAKRMHDAWPDDPEAADVLSTGLARAGRLREAIETLHDLSRKHPERDIVLGRIAGLLNFLTDEAATDPKKKQDLDAIETLMREAAKDPTDLVARFVVATREYYAGKLAEALPQLEALEKSGSRDPRIPLYLAMAHFWLGHQKEAQDLIQHAVDIGPSDPDVFYCRSQIVRKVNLPLAIADLQRYEAMTTRPWSVGPKRKAERVEAELAFLKRGELPPDWDRPGPERAPFDPAHQQGTPVPAEVREGRIALPGAVGPQGDASVVGIGVPATGTGLPAPSHGHGPDAPPPGDEEPPWLPIALVVAIAAALGVRWWTRKPPAA